MSYDLYFKPRVGTVEPSKILGYFSTRANYQVDQKQAWYQNEDTGVYFAFLLQDENEIEGNEIYPVALNINFFRPSYFIREAEPEVAALVREFDMVVSDPQSHGMGDGEYDPQLLQSGWDHGNEFAYSVILRESEKRNVATLPTFVLNKAWSWNLERANRQCELGNSKFVPKAVFLLLAGDVVTAAVWPDGIPIAVPTVDYLIISRAELDPESSLRSEDRTIVRLEDALPILKKHGDQVGNEQLVLNYDSPTQEIVRYVRSLPFDKRDVEGLSPDQVLDRELVEKYSG